MIVLKRLTFADSCCKKGVREMLFPMYLKKKKNPQKKKRKDNFFYMMVILSAVATNDIFQNYCNFFRWLISKKKKFWSKYSSLVRINLPALKSSGRGREKER